MLARQRLLGAGTVACALLCALLCMLPARALASATQESVLMDDNEFIYSSPQHIAGRLDQLKGLGVDRVKISISWGLIAPDPTSRQRPKFDATDPAAYPAGTWDRYDTLVRLAHQRGLKVYFQFTPPAPQWAIPRQQPTNQGIPLGQTPHSGEFGQFVQAVGRRYSGTYLAPAPAGSSSSSTSAPDAIPRVDYWGIWNEPNFPSWLNPWYRKLPHGKREFLQPSAYRGLVDAAWNGLETSGHGADTILIGETANFGNLTPMDFVRALYCVSPAYRPLTGAAARYVGCPTAGNRGHFAAQHPGLFKATGFAHHPYSFDYSPGRPYPARTFVTLYNLSQLEGLLNRTFAAYGKSRRGGVPLYLTEWGYKTDPPNPFVKTSPAQQALWLDEGEYMTWRDPYVRSLAQFLLVDDAPNSMYPVGSRLYWHPFQTGLTTLDGTRKPSFAAYRIPIWLPVARHGHRVEVWGQLRPADHTSLQSAALQYRRAGSASFETIREVRTGSPEGFLVAHVALPSPGQVRLMWQAPGGGELEYSRAAPVG
ncbi:alpha-amylase family protein [Candidatus Nephthysia bennettiae]|uniref:Glycoside hydrolase family 42 N-terminal domain-containing protein n=1 Tax=Candidatus Nephthysia bennettiae TaxID=3127016 RepID=A0A934K250_9BACT|nr:hypothetical protein [Candidatus Dormibacteraeota bacterium]